MKLLVSNMMFGLILMNEPYCRKLIKDPSIEPKAWSISREKEGDFVNEVSTVLCLQQSKTCSMLFVLRNKLGFHES